MTYFKKIVFLLVFTLTTATMACSNTSEEKKVFEYQKEDSKMAFPEHPGTIKTITMLDKTVEIESIADIPEINQFVYYDSKNRKVDKQNAIKAVPIVEVRMYSMNGDKLVSKEKANHIWLEMYDAAGNIIDTHTMWRGGVRGGKHKSE